MPRTEAGAGPLAPVSTDAVSANAVGVGRSRRTTARAAWPPRRLAAVAVVAPALMALFIAVAGASVTSPGWIVLAGLVALIGAATLATYLPRPGSGARLDIGCTPCAVVAALSVPIAVVVLTTSAHDVPSALIPLGVAGFGLWKRLTDPRTCTT